MGVVQRNINSNLGLRILSEGCHSEALEERAQRPCPPCFEALSMTPALIVIANALP